MPTSVDWRARCMSLLSRMACGREQAWDDEIADMYMIGLESLGAEYSHIATCWAVLNEQWRPSIARLRAIAADLASPVPGPDRLFVEFWHKAIASERDPAWTHPILARIAYEAGGWRDVQRHFWHLDESGSDKLHRIFLRCYERAVERWRTDVLAQLTLMPGDRDPEYRIGMGETVPFTPDALLRVAPERQEPDRITAEEFRDYLPPALRARVRSIGRPL